MEKHNLVCFTILLVLAVTINADTKTRHAGDIMMNYNWPEPDQNIKNYPHEEYCHYYYHVEGDDLYTIRKCPKGQIFDYHTHECKKKSIGQCWSHHFGKFKKHDRFYSKWRKHFKCPSTKGKYPDIFYCDKYVSCLNGKPKHKRCPPFKHFDINRKHCVDENEAVCAFSSKTLPAESKLLTSIKSSDIASSSPTKRPAGTDKVKTNPEIKDVSHNTVALSNNLTSASPSLPPMLKLVNTSKQNQPSTVPSIQSQKTLVSKSSAELTVPSKQPERTSVIQSGDESIKESTANGTFIEGKLSTEAKFPTSIESSDKASSSPIKLSADTDKAKTNAKIKNLLLNTVAVSINLTSASPSLAPMVKLVKSSKQKQPSAVPSVPSQKSVMPKSHESVDSVTSKIAESKSIDNLIESNSSKSSDESTLPPIQPERTPVIPSHDELVKRSTAQEAQVNSEGTTETSPPSSDDLVVSVS